VLLTCGCEQAPLAHGHGRSGLANITLQRSGGLASLARRPLSVHVSQAVMTFRRNRSAHDRWRRAGKRSSPEGAPSWCAGE
jgi:hypothetical protein